MLDDSGGYRSSEGDSTDLGKEERLQAKDGAPRHLASGQAEWGRGPIALSEGLSKGQRCGGRDVLKHSRANESSPGAFFPLRLPHNNGHITRYYFSSF